MSSPYSPNSRTDLTDVSGLVAVVTGGGTGLGLIVARALEANGAKVFITGRRQEKLDEAAKLALHSNIIPIQGSTTSHDDVQKAVDVVTNTTGYVDILVNNAGMTTFDSSPDARPMPVPGESSVSEISDYFFNYRPAELWRDTLETNIGAVFTTSMAFLPLLDAGNKRRAKDLPKSQIITIGSTGGLTRFTPSIIYNASKAGVHHLMKNLGGYLVPYDIRTNTVAPGWFPTDMTIPVQKQWEPHGGVMPKTLVPQQRMGNEDELAGTVLYLASKAGGFCNGALIVLDGGFLHNHSGP